MMFSYNFKLSSWIGPFLCYWLCKLFWLEICIKNGIWIFRRQTTDLYFFSLFEKIIQFFRSRKSTDFISRCWRARSPDRKFHSLTQWFPKTGPRTICMVRLNPQIVCGNFFLPKHDLFELLIWIFFRLSEIWDWIIHKFTKQFNLETLNDFEKKVEKVEITKL